MDTRQQRAKQPPKVSEGTSSLLSQLLKTESLSRPPQDVEKLDEYHRKPLEPNQLGSWELRIDRYRVFYDVEEDTVYVTAVGYKEHNDLYIRGRKVIL